MTNIVKLHEGEQRAETLLEALENVIYERSIGLPIPTIIGTLEILKLKLYDDIKEQSP